MGTGKAPHVLRRSVHRVAQMGFAAQATYWSAVMTNLCEALNRPMLEAHPEVAGALAAKTDLLLSGSLLMRIENEAGKLYEASPWAADKRATEIVGPAPVQTADRVPPESLARDMAFASSNRGYCRLRRRVQAAKLHSGHHAQRRRAWHWHKPDGHAQVTDRTATECAMEDGHGVTTWRHAGCRTAIYVCPEEGQ